MRMKLISLSAAVALGGCAETARVFPMNDLATQTGVPKFDYVAQGIGRGPVTITMPNGDVLKGEYQVTENASIGFAFSGGRSATAYGFGGGRPVVAVATGPHGLIANCEGSLDIGGHGSMVCDLNNGARYRLLV